jgi:pimeloyl-ACP methyl ester carboxylesterase
MPEQSNSTGISRVATVLATIGRLALVATFALTSFGIVCSQATAQGDKAQSAAGVGNGFTSEKLTVNGAAIHYVRGGTGPAVVLIHGFPQDWFEYRAIMPRLAKRFTVIAVDLRGIGGSKAMTGGYDAATMAEDVHQLVSSLKLKHVYIVGHDIGGMVSYAFARRYPQETRGAMILDVAIPGLAGWTDVVGNPGFWHAAFMQVPGLPEKLVTGRQADYFGYFFHFGKFTPIEDAHYVRAYGTAAQLHAAFQIYRAFPANVKFNAAQGGPDDVPLFLAAGDGSPFAKLIPKIAEGLGTNGFTHVETGMIHASGHYDVEDQPAAVARLIELHAAERG